MNLQELFDKYENNPDCPLTPTYSSISAIAREYDIKKYERNGSKIYGYGIQKEKWNAICYYYTYDHKLLRWVGQHIARIHMSYNEYLITDFFDIDNNRFKHIKTLIDLIFEETNQIIAYDTIEHIDIIKQYYISRQYTTNKIMIRKFNNESKRII